MLKIVSVVPPVNRTRGRVVVGSVGQRGCKHPAGQTWLSAPRLRASAPRWTESWRGTGRWQLSRASPDRYRHSTQSASHLQFVNLLFQAKVIHFHFYILTQPKTSHWTFFFQFVYNCWWCLTDTPVTGATKLLHLLMLLHMCVFYTLYLLQTCFHGCNRRIKAPWKHHLKDKPGVFKLKLYFDSPND